MNNWLLLICISIISEPKTIRDIEFVKIEGFSSKEKCEYEGNHVSKEMLFEIGNHRERQNIKPNGSVINFPSITYRCMEIKK